MSFLQTELQKCNSNLVKIREFMSNVCVASVLYNIPKTHIEDFKRWYSFLGVKQFYFLDNGSERPVDKAVISQERGNFQDSLRKLWAWVKENKPSKYVLCCDIDEFLFIDNPLCLRLADERPLSFSWFNLIGSFSEDPVDQKHPIFSTSLGFKSPPVKTLCRTDHLEPSIGRSHFPCDFDLPMYIADGTKTKMMDNQTRPEVCTWENGFLLHFKVRSKEDWERKSNYNDPNFPQYVDYKKYEEMLAMCERGELMTRHLIWKELIR